MKKTNFDPQDNFSSSCKTEKRFKLTLPLQFLKGMFQLPVDLFILFSSSLQEGIHFCQYQRFGFNLYQRQSTVQNCSFYFTIALAGFRCLNSHALYLTHLCSTAVDSDGAPIRIKYDFGATHGVLGSKLIHRSCFCSLR